VDDTTKEKSITIKGGGNKAPTLTRIPNGGETTDKNGRVLKVSGGAKIIFENIIINGITASNYYHGALAIGEAVVSAEPKPPISRVTLGSGAVITGKKDGSNSDPEYDLFPTEANSGTGVFTGLYGELVMETGSKVTGCAASGGNFAFAPVVAAGGEFTMNGGEISKNLINSAIGYGGGVVVSYYTIFLQQAPWTSYLPGKFTMNSGEISGNQIICAKNASGGGVCIIGTDSAHIKFTMNGGNISGNTVTGGGMQLCSGGGVHVGAYSIFDMSNSEISGNTVSNAVANSTVNGGGVYVANGSEFEMTNSLITGNTLIAKHSAFGGGVCLSLSYSKFNMISGEISNNEAYSAEAYGGGVCLYYENSAVPQFTMKEGVIYGNSSGLKNTAANGAALSIALFTKTNYDDDITEYPIDPE
jgi:hypothetical protein